LSYKAAVARVEYLWDQPEIRFYLEPPAWTAAHEKLLHSCMHEWTEATLNLKFVRVEKKEDSDIRIAKNTGKWDSLIGTEACQHMGSVTMNFGRVTEDNRHHILHELGHCLGLDHEHQRDDAALDFDLPALNKHCFDLADWSAQDVEEQILEVVKVDRRNSTEYDKDSIMHYFFPPEVFKDKKALKENTEVSEKDLELIARLYSNAEPAKRTKSRVDWAASLEDLKDSDTAKLTRQFIPSSAVLGPGATVVHAHAGASAFVVSGSVTGGINSAGGSSAAGSRQKRKQPTNSEPADPET